MQLPRIALTIGDPAGVGPELALRCAMNPEIGNACTPVLLGSAALLHRVAQDLQLPLPAAVIPVSQLAQYRDNGPLIADIDGLDAAAVEPGRPDAATGRASFGYVETAIELALAQQIAGIATGPIQKSAWQAAGIDFIGHTELLAARTGQPRVRMMLASELIACSLVTVHIGLAEVAENLSVDNIAETIELTHEVFSRYGRPPRISVCGLNPHAGEEGLIGSGEEERLIVPAIAQAARAGIHVRGPLPPDTAFIPRLRSETDAYVCMYHDQGLIPLKALSFDTAVNVTLGLPIVRTSVDHGTGLDRAWQGTASSSSFEAAIRMAVRLAGRAPQENR